MTDKYGPQILVLPEDDHNRQLALGFALHTAVNQRLLRVLPTAGGWRKILDSVTRDHLAGLRRNTERRLVLLMDFDGREDRLDYAQGQVPADLQERVFILGARHEPQDIKRAMMSVGSFEAIGTALAEDCRTNAKTFWSHPELACNSRELERLNLAVKDWLFF